MFLKQPESNFDKIFYEILRVTMDQRRNNNQFRFRGPPPRRWRGGGSNQYFPNQQGRNKCFRRNEDWQQGEYSNDQYHSNQQNYQQNKSLADFLLGESKLGKGGQVTPMMEFPWSDETQEEATKRKLSDVASKLKNKLKSWSEGGDCDDKSGKSESENSTAEEGSVAEEPPKRTAHVPKPFQPAPQVQQEIRRRSNEHREKPPEEIGKIKTVQRNIQRKVIGELLSMPKTSLQMVLNDPKINPKIELGMSHLVKENRLLLAQKFRNLAESKMTNSEQFKESQFVSDVEMFIDPDLAVDLYKLPPELIKQMGAMFQLDFEGSFEEAGENAAGQGENRENTPIETVNITQREADSTQREIDATQRDFDGTERGDDTQMEVEDQNPESQNPMTIIENLNTFWNSGVNAGWNPPPMNNFNMFNPPFNPFIMGNSPFIPNMAFNTGNSYFNTPSTVSADVNNDFLKPPADFNPHNSYFNKIISTVNTEVNAGTEEKTPGSFSAPEKPPEKPKWAKYLKKKTEEKPKNEEVRIESIPLPVKPAVNVAELTTSPVKTSISTPNSNILTPSPSKSVSNMDDFDILPRNSVISPKPIENLVVVKKEAPDSPVSKSSKISEVLSNFEWSSEEDADSKDKNQNKINSKPLSLAEKLKIMEEMKNTAKDKKIERNIKCKNFVKKIDNSSSSNNNNNNNSNKKINLVEQVVARKTAERSTQVDFKKPKPLCASFCAQVDIKMPDPIPTLASFERNLLDYIRHNPNGLESLKKVLNERVRNLHGRCRRLVQTDTSYSQTEVKDFYDGSTQTDQAPEKVFKRVSCQTDPPPKTVKKSAEAQTIIKSSEVSNIYGVPIPLTPAEETDENLLNEVRTIDKVLHKLNERKFNIFLKLRNFNEAELGNSFLHTVTNGDMNVWKHIFTKEPDRKVSSSSGHKKITPSSRDRSHSDGRHHRERDERRRREERKKEEERRKEERKNSPTVKQPLKTKAELKRVTSLSQLKTPLEETVTKDESFVKNWVESQDPTKYEDKVESDSESRSKKAKSEKGKGEKSDRKSEKRERSGEKYVKKTKEKPVVKERPEVQLVVENLKALEEDLNKKKPEEPAEKKPEVVERRETVEKSEKVVKPPEVAEIPERVEKLEMAKKPEVVEKSEIKPEVEKAESSRKRTPSIPKEIITSPPVEPPIPEASAAPVKKKRRPGKKATKDQPTDQNSEATPVPAPKKRKRKIPPQPAEGDEGESSPPQPVNKNFKKKKRSSFLSRKEIIEEIKNQTENLAPGASAPTSPDVAVAEKPPTKRFKRLVSAVSSASSETKTKKKRKAKSAEVETPPAVSSPTEPSNSDLTNKMKNCTVLIERLSLPLNSCNSSIHDIPSENSNESALAETKVEGDCDIIKNFDDNLPSDFDVGKCELPGAGEEGSEEVKKGGMEVADVEMKDPVGGDVKEVVPLEKKEEVREEVKEEINEESMDTIPADVNNSMPFSTATETSDDEDQDTIPDIDNKTVSCDLEMPAEEKKFDSSVSDYSQQFFAVQNGDALSRNSESVQGSGPKKRKVCHISYSCHKGVILDIKVIGKHIFAACEDKLVYCYSMKSGKRKKEYSGHNDAVTTIAFLSGKKDYTEGLLFTGSLDCHVRSFVIKTSAMSKQSITLPSQVQCLEENWGVVYAGLRNGVIMKFNAKTLKAINPPLEVSQQSVLALKTLMEGPRKIIIVATRNNSITIRDGTTGLLLRSIDLNFTGSVYSLTFDSNQIYCGTSEPKLFAFDFTDGSSTGEYECGPGVLSIKLIQNLIFASSYDGKIYVIDSKTKERVGVIPGPGKMLMAMDVYKNRQIVASSNDKKLETWAIPAYIRNLLKKNSDC